MDFFLEEALKEIYQATKGYPRKVTMLCHRSLKEMLMQNKAVVDTSIVLDIIQNEVKAGWQTTESLLQKSSF